MRIFRKNDRTNCCDNWLCRKPIAELKMAIWIKIFQTRFYPEAPVLIGYIQLFKRILLLNMLSNNKSIFYIQKEKRVMSAPDCSSICVC
jgi:hypothetical protein